MTETLSLFDLEDREADRCLSLTGDRCPAPPGVNVSILHASSERRSPVSRSLELARTERDAAMARVADGAGEDWNSYARVWVRDYLTRTLYFFPDDVWDAGLQPPTERRAFGPVVKYAASHGWIVKTDQTRPRTLGHATPGPVWRSTIYGGNQ